MSRDFGEKLIKKKSLKNTYEIKAKKTQYKKQISKL